MGLIGLRFFFSIVTIDAAFSCANSGVYGTVRSLYGLSVEGLAPKFLSRLNKFNVPQIATIFTMVPMWIIMGFGYFLPESYFYTSLLSMSGLTGSICWIFIIACQMKMRRTISQRGYDPNESLKSKVYLYPVLPLIGMIILIFSIVLTVLHKDFIVPAILGLATFILPIITYLFLKKIGKVKYDQKLDEGAFEQKFPDKMNNITPHLT